MKICILSMQRVQNFGSLLQAYALKRIIECQGHSVTFLDIAANEEDHALLDGKVNLFLQEGEKSGGFWMKLRKLDKYTLKRLRAKLCSSRQKAIFELFRTECLNITEGADNTEFDCCVIGSDEVFNCMQPAPWGFTSQLYGNVRQAKKVITYAASCGATKLEQVPEAAKERIRKAFLGVSYFSVRDGNTRAFTTALTEKTVQEHLDPALIYDFSKEIRQVEVPAMHTKPYCIVYAYQNRICEEADIIAIKRFCKEKGLSIVSIGGAQKWIRNHLVLKPFEVLKVFQNADFVITDTFHGTIFSAKLTKRFAIMTRPSNENKLQDLIEKLHLEKHQIKSMEQLGRAYEQIHDLIKTEVLLQTERERTEQYLKESI